jgi:hypothetical protein
LTTDRLSRARSRILNSEIAMSGWSKSGTNVITSIPGLTTESWLYVEINQGFKALGRRAFLLVCSLCFIKMCYIE